MRSMLTSLIALALLSATSPAQSVVSINPPVKNDIQPFEIEGGPQAIALGDLNGDFRPEIVVANRYNESVTVLLNNGNGSFSFMSSYWVGSFPAALVLSDFNEDGKLDLAVANSGSNTISVLTGAGDGAFDKKNDYATGNLPCAIAAGDLNGDKRPDLVAANRYGNTVSVLLANGDGSFKSSVDYEAGRLPRSVVINDFNRDGKADIIVTSLFDHSASVLPGKGDGSFGAAYQYLKGRSGLAAIPDLDGDGRCDFVEMSRDGNSVSIHPSSLIKNAGSNAVYTTGCGPCSVTEADINRDGIRDLIVANAGVYPTFIGSVSVLLGRRDGSFCVQEHYSTGSATQAAIAGDVDGDGLIDIVVANGCYDFGGGVSVLYGAGDGALGSRTDYSIGGHIIWVSFSDDADGKADTKSLWIQK